MNLLNSREKINSLVLVTAKDGRMLKPNTKSIVLGDLKSLLAMFAPGSIFALGLILLYLQNQNFNWLSSPSQYPWQLLIIIAAGTIATIGGIGDWIFHRLFVAAGPRERKSHLLALATGGLPLFILMSWASISSNPTQLLIPIIVVLIYTTTLICYDEFVFHLKRCGAFETWMHRILVFGNASAFLAWFHWIFVFRTTP